MDALPLGYRHAANTPVGRLDFDEGEANLGQRKGEALHCQRRKAADQRRACPRHLFIPDLVPGEVTDAGEDFVSYRMRDSSAWTNDAREEEAAAC